MTEPSGNIPSLPPRLARTSAPAGEVEPALDSTSSAHSDATDVDVLTTLVEEEGEVEPADSQPGYTLIAEDDWEDEKVPLFTPGVTAWFLALAFGLVAPFGSAALLELFPGLVEGLVRLDRNLLAQVDFILLGAVIAGIMTTWAVVIAALAVCIGKRPGFVTGSALALFLLAPPAIMLGIPMLALLFN